jgi:hypothetical protein
MKIKISINGSQKEKDMAKKLCDIPAGRFFRLRYTSSVPLAAQYKKLGYTMQKMVDTTTRTGVQYGNIAGVVLKDDCPTKANNFEWVVKNRIKHNTNTGKNYAVVAPISEGSNTKATYILTDPRGNSRPITREEAKQYTTPSYWKDGTKPPVVTIALENIQHIK